MTTGDSELILTPHPPNRNKHHPPRKDVSEYSFGGSCVRLWEFHVEGHSSGLRSGVRTYPLDFQQSKPPAIGARPIDKQSSGSDKKNLGNFLARVRLIRSR